MIRKIIPFLLIFTALFIDKSHAREIYSCESKYNADENKGLWYFTDSKFNADKKIFFTNSKNKAGLVIYFTESDYNAEWRNKNKMHLFY